MPAASAAMATATGHPRPAQPAMCARARDAPSAGRAARTVDGLEDAEQQPGGDDDGDDLDPRIHGRQIPASAATGAGSPGSTTGRRRARPMNRASSSLTM